MCFQPFSKNLVEFIWISKLTCALFDSQKVKFWTFFLFKLYQIATQMWWFSYIVKQTKDIKWWTNLIIWKSLRMWRYWFYGAFSFSGTLLRRLPPPKPTPAVHLFRLKLSKTLHTHRHTSSTISPILIIQNQIISLDDQNPQFKFS